MERRVLLVLGLVGLFSGVPQWSAWGGTRSVPASRIHVTGASYFSCDEIAEQLSTSLLNRCALSPESPVGDVRQFFESQLAANYRCAGFLDVSVRTKVDEAANEYRIEIEEGSQYLAGEIHITGLPQSDVDAFLKAFVGPGVPPAVSIAGFQWQGGNWTPVWTDTDGSVVEPKPSNWTIGKPVCASDPHEPAIADELQRALAAIGRTTSELEVGNMERDGTTVCFALKIGKLGPPLLGRNLQITGCRKNTPGDVLRFLKIDPDEILTQARVQELRLMLWLSGRFSRIRHRMVSPEKTSDAPAVIIELEEYDKAPLLLEPLSEAEQIMIKFYQWASRLPESNETVLLQLPSAPLAASCLCSPARGFLIRAGNHRVLVHSDRIVYCPEDRQQKLVIPTAHLTLATNIAMDFKEERADDFANISFSMQTKWSPAGSSARLFSLCTNVNPCTCLALVHNSDAECSISDGVLSITSPRSRTKIDARTGRLLRGAPLGEDGKEGAVLSATTEDFESTCSGFEQSWQEYPDCFVPGAPVSSTLRFAAADPTIRRYLLEAVSKRKGGALNSDLLAVLLKLLDHAVLPTADEVCRSWQEDGQSDRRTFVAYGARELYSDVSNENAWSIAAMTHAALGLLPHGTWLYHCVGSVGFSWAGSDRLYRFHAESLFSSPTKSPIRDMLLAGWFQQAHPQTANRLARRGLQSLTPEVFREDRAVLFDEGHYFGRFVVRVAETLQGLTDREVEVLMDECFGGGEPGLSAALQHLREQRDRPVKEVLFEAVEIGWESAWREATKARLSEIAKTTAGQSWKPLWENRLQIQPEPEPPQTGNRFELQGPFSR